MAATTTPKPIYQIGQTIYHRADGESRGIITGIIIRPGHFIERTEGKPSRLGLG